MHSIAEINTKRKVFTSYERCSNYERSKLDLGYKRLAEYESFYLYGRYDREGNLLYKECFSKYDIDGVPKYNYKRHRPIFKWG